MSHGVPAMWTGMIARVRLVIFRATSSGSIVRVAGSTSTRTGRAPRWMMTAAVEVNVYTLVMTSSPGRSSMASRARWRPAVAELTATACLAPT